MKERKKVSNQLVVLIAGLCILSGVHTSRAQDVRWLRVGELQSPYNEVGAEYELEFNLAGTTSNHFSWPAQYSIDQTVTRMKGVLIGCKNFNDPVEKKMKSVKVIGSGPKSNALPDQVFPQEIKLIGKFPHPFVTVDDARATNLEQYDVLDSLDDTIPCDRMILIRYNTSMGVSVTKKVMAFSQSDQDDYFINDYVFTNTGIIDEEGTLFTQTLDSVWFYFHYRYAFGGMSVGSYGQASQWGAFASVWGNSTLNHAFGENPGAAEFNDPNSLLYQLRGFYSYYGPYNGSPRPAYDEDWGCPKLDDPGSGTLGSAKYAGCVTLHADSGPQNQADDLNQPRTTWFISPDITIFSNTSPSQYDEVFMSDRWTAMTEGHPTQQHDEIIGNTYPDTYKDTRRNSGGGVAMGQGYGPYRLAPGESIHIVFAEGVSGLSWEKGREIGSKWLQWRNNSAQPALTMPDGSATTDYNLYKRRWCETGRDSLLVAFRNALNNYKSDYDLPRPPLPPGDFTVISGGDRIQLKWTAVSGAHAGGYVIYRSEGTVLDWTTTYKKLFETDDPAVTSYNDVSAVRGFDYYYYIQSRDDGTQVPGKTLYSSLFWTITSLGAQLGREAAPKTPRAPAVNTAYWQPISAKGEWNRGDDYNAYDVVTLNGKSYVCAFAVADDTTSPDLDDANWRLAADRGTWASGSGYRTYDIVSYNGVQYVCLFDISKGSGLDLVRVVPNPYDIRARMFQFGDQSQYDRIAFYGLPTKCLLRIYTERGDLIWEKEHTRPIGDEIWDSMTSSGQIIVSGIYILHVEVTEDIYDTSLNALSFHKGESVFRKFIVIR